MIQKYFRLAASPGDVVREIAAFDTWPQWWPGVLQARVVRREGSSAVVDLVVKTAATIEMTMEFDFSQGHAVRFRQTKGWFKRYAGDYTFLPVPDGAGTILRITIDHESGMLIPKGMVHAKLSASLAQLEEALRRRIQARPREAAPAGGSRPPAAAGDAGPGATAAAAAAAERRPPTLAHVFAARGGLEVWIGGKPYLLRSLA
jgi:ribosome-associated toxin RatA of RatAB toxin-antitoxin module